ncbi:MULTISPECIES: GlsB/YeaQ/YmgE family stress response membrane protein [Catenuloplanes]|uniref:GlsB/YeaQ/YmgE family stress response membrane protein n=1 Tax=Catenuloplanes niger TaxID=587534 RepID=A0AAE3ZZ78_9ACTN|nr:GlsB/YeaQ/YmgE family stress response membrane protein [Catenuloplanes niger]MDR7327546.1 hypothetical protein [Catenuloplanes niger]
MTISSLVTAIVLGAFFGLSGYRLVPADRQVPFWLPLAAGIGAAVLGTIAARLGGVATPGVSPIEILLQAVLAGLGVAGVILTADRLPMHRQ